MDSITRINQWPQKLKNARATICSQKALYIFKNEGFRPISHNDFRKNADKSVSVIVFTSWPSRRETLTWWTSNNHICLREFDLVVNFNVAALVSMILSERTYGSFEMIRREQSIEACIMESVREPTAAAEKVDNRV